MDIVDFWHLPMKDSVDILSVLYKHDSLITKDEHVVNQQVIYTFGIVPGEI